MGYMVLQMIHSHYKCAKKIDRLRDYSVTVGIKKPCKSMTYRVCCGLDGTRTRDPVRDRHVF